MADANVLNGVTNSELWNLARAADPTFASHTAKATAADFTSKGFEALTRNDITTINDFIGISLRIAFQKLDFPKAKNPARDSGLLQVYDTPNGGYIQRVAMEQERPISPRYLNLENGKSVDPFVVRKSTTNERFFGMNFNYQNLVTVKPYELKQVFLSDYGVGQWIAGKMTALENAYTVQEYENVLECLNSLITSTKHPIKNTQIVSVPGWTDGTTVAELNSFTATIKNLARYMDAAPMTDMYNSGGFNSAIDTNDMTMLVRPDVIGNLETYTYSGAFHRDELALPFEMHAFLNFGGLVPYQDADYTTRLYPAYDATFGNVIGYNTTENSNEATVAFGAEHNFDPNGNVIAIIAQKGLIFENNQNPYQVRPIQNPAGLYDNYWASRPNVGINGDYYYNMVLITKPSAT